MTYYRVTTTFACGAVSVRDGVITNEWTAPIFRKFIGQPWRNMERWRQVVSIDGPYVTSD